MDCEKELIDILEEVATLKADVANLNGWQKNQNGALLRVDSKIENIYKIMIGTAGTAALSFLGTIVTLLVILSTRGGN
ncbi:MAG: hypothetical protein MJA84_07120 [Firmicutes bacterium]|nr:hypothetical protein [Bacillota bacterium]